tara:strand:- start:108 stop:2405 length:2298 start_codon:yes stop_codon:yes gene_type:complete
MATSDTTTQDANAAKLAEKGYEAVNAELDKQAKNLLFLEEQKLKIADLDREKIKLATKASLAQAEINENLRESVKLQRQLKEMEADGSDALSEQITQVQEQIEAKEELIMKEQTVLDLIRKKSDAVKEFQKAEKTYGKDSTKRIEKAGKNANSFSGITQKFAKRLPVVGRSLGKVFDQTASMQKYGKDLTHLSKNMKAGFGKSITGTMGKFLSGITTMTVGVVFAIGYLAKLAVEFDNLSKKIGGATGMGDVFADTLMEGYKQSMASGVSMAQYGQSVTSLANNFSGFNPTAEKTNIHLANTTSRLTKLGVSADSSAKLMDHFHRAMGVSQEMAADMTAQLVMLGKQVGITASKMAADFQASAGRLAIYGKGNIKVFKQLSAQAKATGLAMSTLLGISKKFDTFEGAADSAANLNAVLGTQLSTIELMNATDAERIKMMKEQVQASVGNFDSLDKFTKMHIAKAMGLKDVGEAQRLLNMSEAESAANASKMQEKADVQAKLAEATEKLVPLTQKLKIAFMSFVMAFSPIIEIFTWLLGGLSTFIGVVGKIAAVIGPAIIAGWAIFEVFSAIAAGAAAVATPVGWIIGGIIALVVVFKQLWDLFGLKINPLFVNIFHHLGVGLELMLAPIKAVAAGVGWLAEKFSGFFGEAKKEKADLAGGFDIQALADIDTSAVAAGINEIKSAVMELAGIKMDGFLAMHTDGSSSSFVMGSDGLIKSISEGKLIVDVKMPEMKLPEVLVKVFIGDRELKSIIRTEVKALGGAMG